MCSLGQALQLALPKGLDISEQENIFLVEESFDVSLSDKQKELYNVIAENPGKNKAYYRKKVGASII